MRLGKNPGDGRFVYFVSSQVQKCTGDWRLLNVRRVGVRSQYDIFGNRTEKSVVAGGTTTTRYAYDMWNPAKADATGTSGSDIWAVMNGSSSLTNRQLQGDGIDEHLAYVTSGGNAFWFLSDHLGSIRTVIDGTGATVYSYSYDGFGNVTSVATPSMYAWTGRELDAETGMQYNRARYYDGTTGRWISLDPMGFDAGDSNLYRYVNNRSSTAIDQSGLDIYITHRWPHLQIEVDSPQGKQEYQYQRADWFLPRILNDIPGLGGYTRIRPPGIDRTLYWAAYDGIGTLAGVVVKNVRDQNGKIKFGFVVSQIKTTPKQDAEFIGMLDATVGGKGGYDLVGNSCRAWARDWFNFAQERYGPATNSIHEWI